MLDTGIFIRTTADFDTVWRHFRKFTLLTRESDGSRAYFNFQQPKTLRSTVFAIRGRQNTLVFGLPALFIGIARNKQKFVLGSGKRPGSVTPKTMAVGSLETYINDTSIASFRAEKLEDYTDEAQEFLLASFPWAEAFLGAENLVEGIRLSHDLSLQSNITRTQDHLKLLTVRFFLGSYFETDPFLIPNLHQIGWSSAAYRHNKLKGKQLFEMIDRLIVSIRADMQALIAQAHRIPVPTSKTEAWKTYQRHFPKAASTIQMDPSGKLTCPDTQSLWYPEIIPKQDGLMQLQYPLMGHRAHEDPFRKMRVGGEFDAETYQMDLQYFLLNLVS